MKRLALLAPLFVLAIPDQADAAPPRARADEGIHQGGYIFGAPAVIQFPMHDEDDGPDVEPSWGWGIGGGYLWTPAQYFKIAFGGSFEHSIYNWDNIDYDDVQGNMLRLAAELRIGGGTNKVWGYGLIGPGLAIQVVHSDIPPDPDDETHSDAGFDLTLGGGVQGAVWRSLFLGGELDFDLNFFPDHDEPVVGHDDFVYHQAWIKFIIGWYF